MLWFYELSREQNRGTLAAPKADQLLAELKARGSRLMRRSPCGVFGDVHRLALAYRLTSYDAAFWNWHYGTTARPAARYAR
jgi:hypothetical protein